MVFFKPLLSTGSALAIEKMIDSFRKAGVEDIRVIVGHKADLLMPVLIRLGINSINNPHYDQGMYASVRAGVRDLENHIEAFFLLPANYAFVSTQTIQSLLRAYEESLREVLYPVYRGEKGHPLLISANLRQRILAEEPEIGLDGVLESKVHSSAQVQVEDNSILINLDSEEDYLDMINGRLPSYPTRWECLEILQQRHLPDPALAHAGAVSKLSGRIAESLNSRGYGLHLGVIMAASLLHDIAKGGGERERTHCAPGLSSGRGHHCRSYVASS